MSVADAPKRIQLSRRKGWRMPPNTVIVARPERWGNPFKVGDYARLIGAQPSYTLIETNEQAVDFYRRYAEAWSPEYLARVQRELRGKNLACWCPLDQPCHADVLLELANSEIPDAPGQHAGTRAIESGEGDEA